MGTWTNPLSPQHPNCVIAGGDMQLKRSLLFNGKFCQAQRNKSVANEVQGQGTFDLLLFWEEAGLALGQGTARPSPSPRRACPVGRL